MDEIDAPPVVVIPGRRRPTARMSFARAISFRNPFMFDDSKVDKKKLAPIVKSYSDRVDEIYAIRGFIIYPTSTFLTWWDVLMFIALVYSANITPFTMSFLVENPCRGYGIMNVIDWYVAYTAPRSPHISVSA